MHICVSRLTITGSDNDLSPGRRQAINWTNAGILLIGPLGANFSENSIEILTFSFTKMRLKVSSAKWRLFGLGPNELIQRDPSWSPLVRFLFWQQRWSGDQVGSDNYQSYQDSYICCECWHNTKRMNSISNVLIKRWFQIIITFGCELTQRVIVMQVWVSVTKEGMVFVIQFKWNKEFIWQVT